MNRTHYAFLGLLHPFADGVGSDFRNQTAAALESPTIEVDELDMTQPPANPSK